MPLKLEIITQLYSDFNKISDDECYYKFASGLLIYFKKLSLLGYTPVKAEFAPGGYSVNFDGFSFKDISFVDVPYVLASCSSNASMAFCGCSVGKMGIGTLIFSRGTQGKQDYYASIVVIGRWK